MENLDLGRCGRRRRIGRIGRGGARRGGRRLGQSLALLLNL